MKPILVPPEIQAALAKNAPVALNTSGGKDSSAVALAVLDYLNEIGHKGPRILIHANLGQIEWDDSLPTCQRLAEFTETPLVVVRRKQGDMIDRWRQRWRDNVARWENLEVTCLILPWSTPAWRFCTSELKSAPIAQELVRRWPNAQIINVTGVRAEESANRAKQPVCKCNPRLDRKEANTTGLDWSAIHHWTEQEVYAYLTEKGFDLHEAYVVYKTTRVSCSYCIMASLHDMQAACRCEHNLVAWHMLMDLEHSSAFQFQRGRWLADLAPHRVSNIEQRELARAKEILIAREALERQFPEGLELKNRKAQRVPTIEEATLIARLRTEIGALMSLTPSYTTADAVIERYEEIIESAPTAPTAQQLDMSLIPA